MNDLEYYALIAVGWIVVVVFVAWLRAMEGRKK